MHDRRAALRAISASLGRRDLIWAGLRADDVAGITDLPNLAGSFSIVGGHGRGYALDGIDYEDLTGVRVDLDAWDIDDNPTLPTAQEFREAMLRRLVDQTAVLPYRSSHFLSSILLPRRDRCLDLGLFGTHQTIFEHKPWVEFHVAEDLRVPRVVWTYVADEEKLKVRRMLEAGPVMLRRSRTSGGAGLVRVDDPADLAQEWPTDTDRFVSVAPFMDQAVPINLGATVWQDGVTINHPSVQLIGIPELTQRPYGYCGNDFGMAAEMDAEVWSAVEVSTRALGTWLRGYGYLGTFGVDYLVHHGVPYFMEINARFQGSTHASSQLSVEAGEPCILLDHMAALLGHPARRSSPLEQQARDLPPLAHFVVHWDGPAEPVDGEGLIAAARATPGYLRADVAAKAKGVVEPGGVVARVTVRDRLTDTGFALREPWASAIRGWYSIVGRSTQNRLREGTR